MTDPKCTKRKPLTHQLRECWKACGFLLMDISSYILDFGNAKMDLDSFRNNVIIRLDEFVELAKKEDW